MYGIFIKFQRRNKKTGESIFTIKDTTNAFLTCKGIICPYSKGTPLKIEGDCVLKDGIHYINVTSVYAYAFNEDAAINFLKCRLENIGDEKAKKIIKETGINIFEYTRTPVSSSDINVQRAYKIARNCTYFEDLYDYVIKCSGDYSVAYKLYLKNGMSALSKIKANPYKMLSVGVNYNIVEHFAKDNELMQYDERRISGIVRTAIENSRNNGNTKISFLDLYNEIRRIEITAGCGYSTHPLLIAKEINLKYDIETDESDNTIYIYRKKDNKNENIIAKNIARITSSRTFYEYTVPENTDNLSKEQTNTLNMLKSSGIKILTGGPGTGKTTTVKTIIQEYKKLHPYNSIILLAPTGCAARRLAEATGIPAITIHSCLGINGYDEDVKCNKIDANFVIADEFTFVDTELAAKFFNSIKNNTTVLLIGDTNQLLSIEPGNVFGDMIDSKSIECYQLTKIFRQEKDNLIAINSKKVIEGDSALNEGCNFKIFRYKNEKEIIEEVKRIADSCYKRKIDFKLYTPVRKPKYDLGTIKMNRLLKSIYHKELNNKIPNDYEYGYNSFAVGDKVIFTYNVKDKFYNGQEGIVKYIEVIGSKETIVVDTLDGEISVSGENLDYLELAYTITAHKSQGSECENALIIIPKKPYSMLKRQLLYVEITRARKNVIIISEDNAIDICISNYGEHKRQTGLVKKIKLYIEM